MPTAAFLSYYMNKPVITDVVFKEVAPEQLGELAAMHMEIWQQAYRHIFTEEELDRLKVKAFEDAWRLRTADGGRQLRWVSLEGKKVGFLSFVQNPNAVETEVTHFYFLPAYWGSGTAAAAFKQLLLMLISEGARKVRLWILKDNHRARLFYREWNFKLSGNERNRMEQGLRLEEYQMEFLL